MKVFFSIEMLWCAIASIIFVGNGEFQVAYVFMCLALVGSIGLSSHIHWEMRQRMIQDLQHIYFISTDNSVDHFCVDEICDLNY